MWPRSLAAETSTTMKGSADAPPLQCGRGRLWPWKRGRPAAPRCPQDWLQCGRGRLAAETGDGDQRARAESVTSMWPRSSSRGNTQTRRCASRGTRRFNVAAAGCRGDFGIYGATTADVMPLQYGRGSRPQKPAIDQVLAFGDNVLHCGRGALAAETIASLWMHA